jgi:serine O-acetyltransferase
MAEKMGFDAYGVTKDSLDPVAHAINCILDHSHAVDTKIDQMCKAIKALGAEFKDEKLPELGPSEIGSIADEEPFRTSVDESKKPEN